MEYLLNILKQNSSSVPKSAPLHVLISVSGNSILPGTQANVFALVLDATASLPHHIQALANPTGSTYRVYSEHSFHGSGLSNHLCLDYFKGILNHLPASVLTLFQSLLKAVDLPLITQVSTGCPVIQSLTLPPLVHLLHSPSHLPCQHYCLLAVSRTCWNCYLPKVFSFLLFDCNDLLLDMNTAVGLLSYVTFL